eukprot:COSAG01_NODE_14621_length_1430_cov_176.319309_3_plen_87_part_00
MPRAGVAREASLVANIVCYIVTIDKRLLLLYDGYDTVRTAATGGRRGGEMRTAAMAAAAARARARAARGGRRSIARIARRAYSVRM